jgi:hypothetical protein
LCRRTKTIFLLWKLHVWWCIKKNSLKLLRRGHKKVIPKWGEKLITFPQFPRKKNENSKTLLENFTFYAPSSLTHAKNNFLNYVPKTEWLLDNPNLLPIAKNHSRVSVHAYIYISARERCSKYQTPKSEKRACYC